MVLGSVVRDFVSCLSLRAHRCFVCLCGACWSLFPVDWCHSFVFSHKLCLLLSLYCVIFAFHLDCPRFSVARCFIVSHCLFSSVTQRRSIAFPSAVGHLCLCLFKIVPGDCCFWSSLFSAVTKRCCIVFPSAVVHLCACLARLNNLRQFVSVCYLTLPFSTVTKRYFLALTFVAVDLCYCPLNGILDCVADVFVCTCFSCVCTRACLLSVSWLCNSFCALFIRLSAVLFFCC